MPRLLHGYRLDVGGDKADDEKRIARYKMVKDNATTTVLYTTDDAYRAAVDAYLARGLALSTDRDDLEKANHTASVAETTLVNTRTSYDAAYDVLGQCLLARATGVEDLKNGGFSPVAQEAVPREVALPTGLQVKFDLVTSAIKVHVTFADKGKHHVYVEVSPEPIGPTSFQRLDTTGVRQSLRGYAPGLWWIRVAAFRARQRSEWFGPVSVLVK